MRQACIARSGGVSAGQLLLLLVTGVFVVFYVLPYLLWRPDRAINVRQKGQLHSIEAALELFDSQFKGYPPSDANDVTGTPYCGAMKLAEAMMGQDAMRFHSKSAFRADGLDPNGLVPLYATDTISARLGAFLPLENANLNRLVDIYGKTRTGPFPDDTYVLCDTYAKKRPCGKKIGMPILYYHARTGGTAHDGDNPDDPENIYDYRDNLALIKLGAPGDPNVIHPLASPRRFYLNTRDDKATPMRPYRSDSYILISAGWDGLYGTADDICNFDWSYHK